MLFFLCFVGLAAAGSIGHQQNYGQRPAPGFVQPRPFRQSIQPIHHVQPVRPVAPAPAPFIPGSSSASKDCITKPGPWSSCSASCGGGLRSRSLTVIQQPSGYGSRCPQLHDETENCNSHPCPIDCEIEEGQYSPCSATCGSGTRTKIDIIVREAKYGGLACPAPDALRTTVPCHQLPPCPVPQDCEIQWGPYSQCTATCGFGTKTRNAYILTQALNGGAPCPEVSQLVDTVQCQVQPCQEVYDCIYLQSEWSQCSASCGQGYRKRQVYIIAQPENGGQACPPQNYQQEPCNAGPCPVVTDCEVSWSHFSQCTKDCGGGVQSLTGQVIRYATAGGAPCPLPSQLHVTRSCNNQQCYQVTPADCEIVYGPYSECSADCGGGYRYRKGYIKTEGRNGGLQCPNPSGLLERVQCNTFACAPRVDCEIQRSYWSECSKSCGGGVQSRTVQIVTQASNGGLPCPASNIETRACNNDPCAFVPPQRYGSF